MSQTEFHIGDRCLFSFATDKNIPVKIIAYYKGAACWVTPENKDYLCDYAVHDDEICGEYAFVTHISHLKLADCPAEEDNAAIDISTLI